MFFHDWHAIERVLLTTACSYAALVLILRISGKRTLAKMNAFDFVVTIALGSILGSMAISKDTSLSQGLAALVGLIGLQWLVAWISVRSSLWRKLIKSEPRLLASRSVPERGDARGTDQRGGGL